MSQISKNCSEGPVLKKQVFCHSVYKPNTKKTRIKRNSTLIRFNQGDRQTDSEQKTFITAVWRSELLPRSRRKHELAYKVSMCECEHLTVMLQQHRCSVISWWTLVSWSVSGGSLQSSAAAQHQTVTPPSHSGQLLMNRAVCALHFRCTHSWQVCYQVKPTY